MYVYCVYPAISKSPNCLKITETSAILIISFCLSIWIRYQKCFIRSRT